MTKEAADRFLETGQTMKLADEPAKAISAA
jgi:hypothetical protein